MINKVKITNFSDAESYSFNKDNREYDIWITVVGEEDRRKVNRMRDNFREKNVRFFFQFFADWSEEDGIQWKHLEREAPRRQHIQNIVTFLKPYVEDNVSHNLGVNCYAGISRSTAIGITALVMAGRTPEQALKEILKARTVAWPNIRILGFASEILGKDIKTHVVNWKKCSLEDGIFVPDRMQPSDE
jgi:predicted protein tyrosine phosphatase